MGQKMKVLQISGFSDEISSDFTLQLQTVAKLGMRHIALRSAGGRGVETYNPQEAEQLLLPLLREHGVAVSLLGSPIGKVAVQDETAYEQQLGQLNTLCALCKLFGCGQIRIFSFYIPEGENPEDYRVTVVRKLKGFAQVAARHQVTLVHENEKDIYGSTALRCRSLLDAVDSPWLKAAFDFANFVQCGEDTRECWALLGRDVADIHIKDAHYGSGENVLCGTGQGHIPELLKKAIVEEGYRGFLTLEPHLVVFDFLQSLELKDAAEVIGTNKAKDGQEGYAMQYEALCAILADLGAEVG